MIYDDKCYSCAKFAQAANALSRGWIRIAGHYYSQEAQDAKKMIFPSNYDSTKMFWLINKSGAYGARAGLPQVAREIMYGIIASREPRAQTNLTAACEYDGEKMSCYEPTNVLRRIGKLLSHGKTFRF